jgi:hypothetical protein
MHKSIGNTITCYIGLLHNNLNCPNSLLPASFFRRKRFTSEKTTSSRSTKSVHAMANCNFLFHAVGSFCSLKRLSLCRHMMYSYCIRWDAVPPVSYSEMHATLNTVCAYCGKRTLR